MAALGTLVTIVTADTSGFSTQMATAAEDARSFARKTEDALGGTRGRLASLQGELGKFASQFGSLKSLVMLGGGLELGEGLFRSLHVGAEKLVGGMIDAGKAGADFNDIIGDGLKSMLGMETSVARVERHLKESSEWAKRVGEAVGINARLDDLLAPEDPRPGAGVLSARGEVEKLRSQLRDIEQPSGGKLSAVGQAAEEIARAKEKLRDAEGALATAKSEWEGKIGANRVLGGYQHDADSSRARLTDLEKEHGAKLVAANEIRDELNKAESKLAEITRRDAESRTGDELHKAHEEDAAFFKELADTRRKAAEELFGRQGEEMAEAFRLSEDRRREEEQNEQGRLKEMIDRRKAEMKDNLDFMSGSSIHDAIQRGAVGGGKPPSNAEQQEKQTRLLEQLEKNSRTTAAFETGGIV